MIIRAGDSVELRHEDDCIVPAGWHTVADYDPECGLIFIGNIGVWERRVVSVRHYEVKGGIEVIDSIWRHSESP